MSLPNDSHHFYLWIFTHDSFILAHDAHDSFIHTCDSCTCFAYLRNDSDSCAWFLLRSQMALSNDLFLTYGSFTWFVCLFVFKTWFIYFTGDSGKRFLNIHERLFWTIQVTPGRKTFLNITQVTLLNDSFNSVREFLHMIPLLLHMTLLDR